MPPEDAASSVIASLVLATAVRLTIDPHPIATFDPRVAFGATVDAHELGQTAKIFTPENIRAMRSAGFHTLSYRLATELAGEAWHWNPAGTWSDAAHARGYWTSSDRSAAPIATSYGYRLPRRGNTLDQFHRDAYSAIDDGDLSTFWKSNPYLASRPQWFVVDLGSDKPVRTMRIAWAEPYAIDFRVERWIGDDPIEDPGEGRWVAFPNGIVRGNTSRDSSITLAGTAVVTRFVRVLMTRSSNTAPRDATDARDREGFAVAEVWIDSHVRHGRSSAAQSIVWVSSTDPWHRASDIDRSIEQPGFDLVLRSGLTDGTALLVPVSLLYGTPEDAAAELRYLRWRGAAVERIEMGEEPDGQSVQPEDYAALYERFADALHAVDPHVALGGPAFQSTVDVVAAWADARHRTSWISRFVDALRSDGRLRDFAFFSFEWYPFDEACAPARRLMTASPGPLAAVVSAWRREGLPRDVPMLATEYGWSSSAAEPEVRIEAALFNAEFVASFLALGGEAAYFYGLEPNVPIRELGCPSFGNLMLFLGDADYRIQSRVPAYWAAWLMTQRWCMASGSHALHAVTGTTATLRAYAVTRPDGSSAILIINRDPERAVDVQTFDGDLAADQYSADQFVWRANGEQGRVERDDPPRHFVARGAVRIPPYSLTVITASP